MKKSATGLRCPSACKVCMCAAEAIFCCPTENSQHLKSWTLSKNAAFHNEKESRRIWPRSQISLEKSSKNYSHWENEPNQTSCKRPPPPPAKSNGEYFPRVFHVVIPDALNSPAIATRHSGWQLLGERGGDLRFDITHQRVDSFPPHSNWRWTVMCCSFLI